MVVAQVEGVALPAASREVPEVALPGPRSGELAVDEQERLPPRSTLGQPRLHVDPALIELDLVLSNRPAVGGWHLGSGEDLLGGRLGHGFHHSCGLMTRPVRAL